MKYKVGDKVLIKSLDWYNKNKDEIDQEVDCGSAYFISSMVTFCGQVVTISSVQSLREVYHIKEDGGTFDWTDEMIEGLAEEETKPNIIEEAKTYWDSIKDAWICPQGYQFVDENGNVINAQKIVLEKKKNEYPKTYEDCAKVLLDRASVRNDFGYKGELLVALQKLLVCRDAYWKIAGEEMGLGRSWKPSDSDYITERYCIFVHRGNILCDTPAQDCFLTFPTEEMRDAFYENFKELIKICKVLL